MSVLGRGGCFRPCIANTGHAITSRIPAENGGGGALRLFARSPVSISPAGGTLRSHLKSQIRSITNCKRTVTVRQRQTPLPNHGSFDWGRAIPYNVASRLVADLDKRSTSASDEPSQARLVGSEMPSSLMHKLNIMSYADVRRRRQRHGLRAQVLAALSELKHLIYAHAAGGDRSGRVFRYLEELNRLYLDLLRVHAQPLQLRSASSCTLDMRRIDCLARNPTVSIATPGSPVFFAQRVPQGTLTKYYADDITSPLFDPELYHVHRRQRARLSDPDRIHTIDPCRPSWIDYFVGDLTESESHQLFILVARSKVPSQVASKYRTAIEEALAFAFNRRGYALDPVESMRVCAFFIRQDKCDQAQVEQLMPLWKHAGAWCVSVLGNVAHDGSGQCGSEVSRYEEAVKELRFKRWSNVASEMIVSLCSCQHLEASAAGAVRDAWSLVGEWHQVWTLVMRALCADGRRGFVDGSDQHTYPYWRPKLPGRFRLHELTLSTKAINRLLARLVKAGHSRGALELLGFATSEAGVPVDTSLFNVALHGLVNGGSMDSGVGDDGGLYFCLSSLSDLPLANSHAALLFGTGEPDELLGTVQALLRGMVRWKLTPDGVTLDALVLFCCRTHNQELLDAILHMFAAKWRIVPSDSLRLKIFEHCLYEPEID
ncbi:hypothetical protein IWW38_003532 [Coemansia aciculifera]|uniref:Uncharacterized protein n=1 Tax=Coemansia aciculifera TaxID=417176 RepID=A0ACC1M1H1_9FUNG|nr:hypothetical protein IWW38_003532 [Coemansia aciculifera]